MIYLSSDSHFGDANCLKYRHRPFETVDEMNETIVANWNALVGPDDVVYHLGDFAITNEGVEEFAPRLNGEIHLLMGNYELLLDEPLLERSFSSVSEAPFSLPMIKGNLKDGFGESGLWLCHYPVQRHPSIYTATGHIHSLWQVAYRMINVGLDAWHFRPIPIQWVFDAEESENKGRWDANVYPDAPLALRWMMSTKIKRSDAEPTLQILEEELRSSMLR